jgi:hypothetical protein
MRQWSRPLFGRGRDRGTGQGRGSEAVAAGRRQGGRYPHSCRPFDDGCGSRPPGHSAGGRAGSRLDARPAAVRTIGRWEGLPGGEPPYATGVAGLSASSRSPWCARGDHDRCPHWVGMRVRELWRLRPRQEVILCSDPCHSRRHCPLAGGRKAARDEWTARCSCPGADASRRSFERSGAKRRELAAVFADVDLSDHPDAETVERRLRDVFQAHGEQLPPGLTGVSRAVAAGTGPFAVRPAARSSAEGACAPGRDVAAARRAAAGRQARVQDVPGWPVSFHDYGTTTPRC